MTLMTEIRDAIRSNRLPPIFNRTDVLDLGIQDPNRNLYNYDKKNSDSSTKNTEKGVSSNIPTFLKKGKRGQF